MYLKIHQHFWKTCSHDRGSSQTNTAQCCEVELFSFSMDFRMGQRRVLKMSHFLLEKTGKRWNKALHIILWYCRLILIYIWFAKLSSSGLDQFYFWCLVSLSASGWFLASALTFSHVSIEPQFQKKKKSWNIFLTQEFTKKKKERQSFQKYSVEWD